jgi:hypothetical protein
MDVKSAFLNDVIHEEVYVRKPPRFLDRVYKLFKSLYMLNQVSRA